MVPAAMKHRGDGDSSVRLSRTIVDKARTEKTGILSEDATLDILFKTSESIADFKIRSLLCVSMLVNDEPIGIISLDSQSPVNRFNSGPTGVFANPLKCYERLRAKS